MENADNNALFSGLNGEQKKFVLALMTGISYKRGETIIRENSTGNSMYVLKDGGISIEKELIPLIEGYKPTADDKKVIKADSSQNFFFGEMSLFDPALKRTATIKAVTDVELLELKDTDLNKILTERQDIGVVILKNIALKLSRTLETSNIELSKMITAFTLSLKL